MAGALSLRGVSRSFKEKEPVLSGLDADIPQGKIFVILGRSGCGKTTLLRIMGGFDGEHGGSVYLDGREIKSPCRDMLMMFQSYDQLFPWLTLGGNLRFALTRSGKEKDRKRAKRLSREFLQKTGLSGFENAFPHTLSGGMKQRGALARALCLAPQVLLMDEPFSSLDPLTRREMQALLMQLQREMKTTVVLVTHDISEALAVGDGIAVLKNGKLLPCEKDAGGLEMLLSE